MPAIVEPQELAAGRLGPGFQMQGFRSFHIRLEATKENNARLCFPLATRISLVICDTPRDAVYSGKLKVGWRGHGGAFC